MKNTVKMSMEDYMGSLRSDIDAIKEQPENGCCDAVETKVLENVLGIMNTHFTDYDTLCSENKAMAEFLGSLGYSQEQIADIVNGGKPDMQKTLKYGYKKDHLLAHNISKEAIDVISNFADWKPSTRSLFSGYTGSIFAHETIKMLSKQDFYLANDCPSDDVLRELAELAEEMFVNGCDTVYA